MNDIDAEVEEDFTQRVASVLTNETLPQKPVPLVAEETITDENIRTVKT